MTGSIYRIALALGLVVQVLWGVSALSVAAFLYTRGVAVPGLDGATSALLGAAALLGAWCCWLALRWADAFPRQSIALALGVGVSIMGAAIVAAPFGNTYWMASFELVRGAVIVTAAGAVWRHRIARASGRFAVG
jgi:hypothetical protein